MLAHATHTHTLQTQGEGIYKPSLLCPLILTHIPLPPSSPLLPAPLKPPCILCLRDTGIHAP